MNRLWFQKWGCQSSVNFVVTEHHIKYGSLKTLLYPDYSETIQDCINQLRGVPTEDVAMLNVSERGYWLHIQPGLKGTTEIWEPLMHSVDSLLTWLSWIMTGKRKRKKKKLHRRLSSQLSVQGQNDNYIRKTNIYILLTMWPKW